MTEIHADNVSLTYRLPTKIKLSFRDRRLPKYDDRISGSGRGQSVAALKGISFSLSPGDRLGLVGRNGAGKTTLLKVLYGVYPPTEGRVVVRGRVDALFDIGTGFRPEATGRRNIEIRGLINGWSKEYVDAQIDEIIEFSELGEFIDLPLKAYSKGMAARLAFSIATNMEPEILLMDEWIGAGDKDFQEKARTRMDALAEKAGIIVLASHNHKLLARTCNLVLELERGQISRFWNDIKDFEKNYDGA